jgi:hypothetical protein
LGEVVGFVEDLFEEGAAEGTGGATPVEEEVGG